MDPTSITHRPAEDAGYTPYFYHAGLFLRYGSPSDGPSLYPSSSPVSGYRRSSTVPWGQTVEQIIAHGYLAVPAGDPISAILSDRQHVSRLGLDDVVSQIRRRYQIHDDVLCRIDRAKCAATNAIYEHEAYVGPPSSKQMYAKHKAIQDLYEEERKEETELWRDVSRLRLQLPESTQMYLAAYRKMAALNDNGDVEP